MLMKKKYSFHKHFPLLFLDFLERKVLSELARLRKNVELRKRSGSASESAQAGPARLRKKVELRKKVDGLRISPARLRRAPQYWRGQARPGHNSSRLLVLVSQIEKKK